MFFIFFSKSEKNCKFYRTGSENIVNTKYNKKNDLHKGIEKLKVDIKNCPSRKNARGTIVNY